jgi:hypothetical protein
MATVDEATEVVASASVDLAIQDVKLQGMSSYPVAELLIAHRIPFVFATSGTAARGSHRAGSRRRCSRSHSGCSISTDNA